MLRGLKGLLPTLPSCVDVTGEVRRLISKPARGGAPEDGSGDSGPEDNTSGDDDDNITPQNNNNNGFKLSLNTNNE